MKTKFEHTGHRSKTPKSTEPQPTRRGTKHRYPEFGRSLLANALARRVDRPARPSKGWKDVVAVIADVARIMDVEGAERAEFERQMTVARDIMDEHREALARLAQ